MIMLWKCPLCGERTSARGQWDHVRCGTCSTWFNTDGSVLVERERGERVPIWRLETFEINAELAEIIAQPDTMPGVARLFIEELERRRER